MQASAEPAQRYTRAVAEFVGAIAYESIPKAALEAAKDVVLDSIGVALAGSHEPPGRIAADVAREDGGLEEAVVLGQGFRTSATSAAFANGVATHALDYDASFAIMGQPMAGLVPTVLALGEPAHASGRQALEAYVAGYEVTAKVARSMPPRAGEGAWHATATIGSLGCTAAAARLLHLSVDQTRMALGIVSSMASGVVANFGTMSKPLHAGLATRNGVLAARLAQRGFTGNPLMLEGTGGFFGAFASDVEPTALESLGHSFEIEDGVRYKAYPCGGLTHSAVDAVLALREEDGIEASAIERIDVAVNPYTAQRIIFAVPATGLQGKFCMPYILARTVIDGQLTPDTFTDQAIQDQAVLALAERIHMEADPQLQTDEHGARPARVVIHLRDGRSLSRRVDHARGSPHAPFSTDDLTNKFMACAVRALSQSAARDALDLLEDLENAEDIGVLSGLLLGDSPQGRVDRATA
jgi:2-methylcitrate dehydratase PrpD